MLSKPEAGWSDFCLEGTSVYGVSYLDDIAFEWIDQAIHGLKTMQPFCVKGCLEPRRFLCMVSYWNCHIIIEDDGPQPLDNEDIIVEYSHTNMLEFCKYLHKDISENVGEWTRFVDYSYEEDEAFFENKEMALRERLKTLECLILSHERDFSAGSYFM